jgi:peptidoglycan/LPS O-acetylase OafA/YrhL
LIPVCTFILKNANHRAVRWLEWRWLARIGVLSYSIYLFHEMRLSAIALHVPLPRPVCMLISLPVCYLIALGIDRFVDKHAMRERLLGRLGYGKPAPSVSLRVQSA